MVSLLPSYESSTATPFKPQIVNYRLYIRYHQRDVFYEYDPLASFKIYEQAIFSTRALPFDTSIRPSSHSVEEVLKDTNQKEAFNIVIEGNTRRELKDRRKIYTSIKYWNSFSYMEEMKFKHQYYLQTIKKAIKNDKKKLETLVIGIWPFVTTHIRVHDFFGASKGEARYTLQVKFKKTFELRKYQQKKLYIMRTNTLSTMVLDKEEIIDFNQYEYYKGPTLEFHIKSDDVMALKEMRDNFMDLNLPSEKCRRNDYFISIHSGCLESEEKSPKLDKIIINSGSWSSEMLPCYHYN